MKTRHMNPSLLRLPLAGLLLAASPLEAEFALNFKPQGASSGWGGGGGGFADVECNSSSSGGGGTGWGGGGGGNSWGGGFRGCGTGYFLQETLNGYYHLIIGDPATDFALEFYIGGGNDSASGGDFNNWRYPLSSSASISGNGTGDPTQVHMRQVVKGEGMVQETLKAKNANKPKITQDVNDGALSSQFAVDMTNSTYANKNTAGTMINKQTLVTPGLPPGVADFDVSKDGQKVRVTGGQFSHPGGVGRTYSYLFGGFDVYSVNWIKYCDPGQNPDHDCDLAGGSSSGSSRGGWGGGGGGW